MTVAALLRQEVLKKCWQHSGLQVFTDFKSPEGTRERTRGGGKGGGREETRRGRAKKEDFGRKESEFRKEEEEEDKNGLKAA